MAESCVFGVVIVTGNEEAIAVFLSHVDASVEEVAQASGELFVVGHEDALVVEVGVVASGDVAHEVVAQAVGSELIGEGVWVDDVAEALAHFGAFDVPPAVDDESGHLFVGETEGVEHGHPVDGVGRNEDVFADDFGVCGPEVGEAGQSLVAAFVGEVAGEGNVVGEGIKPDVVDEALIEGKRYAPGEALGGP